jgi:hypothetical protein
MIKTISSQSKRVRGEGGKAPAPFCDACAAGATLCSGCCDVSIVNFEFDWGVLREKKSKSERIMKNTCVNTSRDTPAPACSCSASYRVTLNKEHR